MAEAIAVVLEVEGDVWARDADGDMRLLRAGDSVYAGETVVTAQDARVNLDLSNGDTVQLASSQSLLISAEMLAEAETSSDEQAVTDPSVEEVLALLEGDGDILEELEDPAAGTTGGSDGGGRTIVEVTRIVEQIDPLAFNFAGPTRDPNEPTPGVTGVAETQEAAAPVEPSEPTEPNAPEETSPAITVNLDDQNGQTVAESLISGTTSNVEPGQTVSIEVTDGENTVTTSAIVQVDGSYQVVEDLSSLSDGELTATATVSDQAGNEATDTDTALLDTQAEATITIDTIAGDDVINEEESGETITITGSVGGDAGEGDTVTLTVGGETFDGTVAGDGNYAIDVPGSLLASNEEVGASVSGSDDAGNDFSASTSRPYTVDTEAAATITIDEIAGDDVINETEAEGDEDGNITITGSVGGDASEGDTVTLTVGEQTYTGEVDDQNGYAIDVPGSVLAANSQVDANVTGTDQAGNPFSADADREYGVDTEAAATITIDTIAGDDVINAEESEGDITITGSVTGDAAEGDTVTLTVGGQTYTGEVDDQNGYAIDVPGNVLAANSQVDANVTGTDEAGNPFSADADREYGVDTEAAATITINTIAGDDVINAEESEGNITITGSVGGDASEGDTVTLTVGEQTYTGEVDGDGNYAIDVPGSVLAANSQVDANVTGTDEAGNPFSADADREYGVDTEAAATITIDTIAGDDVINAEESEGDITITGSVGGDAAEGDTVTLTIGGETFDGLVDADSNYAIDVPGSVLAANSQVDANVTGTDEAGNPFSADADREYGVDTEAAATITIDTIAGDDVINAEESDGDITITGSVGGDAAEGDTVTLTVGGETFDGLVDADGNYAIDVPGSVLATNSQVDANVTGTDQAGNPFSADADREYGVDTEAAATITIDTIAGNDVINAEEAEGDITITGSVGGDAAEGDTVTLTIGGETFDGLVDADSNYAIDVPGSVLSENDQVGASVTGSDQAGNDFSASASREYALNTPPVADPVSTTAEVVNADAVLPDGVSGSPLLFKQFSVDGTVDGDNAEPSPTLGGDDAETPLDELTFTLESIPTTGTLFIDIDGDGTYASAQEGDEFSNDSTFYWLDDGSGSNTINVDFSDEPTADSGITLYAYGYDGAQDNTLLNFQGDGVGVSDDTDNNLQQQVPNQLGYRDGNSQTLVMDFDGPAHGAEISVSRLIKNEGEVGKVEAYLDGEQVGAWTFSGVDGATLNGESVDFNTGGSNGGFNLPDGIAFDQLRFTATEYADGYQATGSSNDSSEYFVDSISYKTFSPAEFEYRVNDSDGAESDSVTVEIGVPETNTDVPESFEIDAPSITVVAPEAITVDEAFLETGTRAGEVPAAGEPGATATGQFTLNAPAGLGTLSIAGAVLASDEAGSAGGQVTLNAGQLAALNDEPLIMETPEGNTLRLTGFDADSGTVDFRFELNQAVTNVNGEPLDKAPIRLELTDSNGTSAQATLNVAILDDGVDTTDDPLTVTAGGTADGNVLDNDTGADVDLEVTSVAFAGIEQPVPENGDSITIAGDNGTLTIGRDGAYSYVANPIEPVTVSGNEASWESATGGLWGFGGDTATPLTADGSLDVLALGKGNDNVSFSDNNQKSGVGVEINQSAKIDSDDALLIHLDDSTTSATVSIAQFNANQSEVGRWTAYNDAGEVVQSSTFDPVNNNGFPFDLTISTTESFSYLEFSLDTAGTNKNAGFVIDELTYTPTREFEQDSFTYTVVDQDGSTAEGTLSAFMHSDDLTPVIGTEGDDALVGSDADEAFAGLAGGDTLTGGLGDDVFKWTLADQGDTNAPANDVITDFGTGNDVLDLRDLLVDEENEDKPIGDFMSVAEDGDDLVFQVTHDGGSDGATQTITLQDKSFSDFGGATNSDELIQNMLDSGQLKIDT